jgi:hypothetical protein
VNSGEIDRLIDKYLREGKTLHLAISLAFDPHPKGAEDERAA